MPPLASPFTDVLLYGGLVYQTTFRSVLLQRVAECRCCVPCHRQQTGEGSRSRIFQVLEDYRVWHRPEPRAGLSKGSPGLVQVGRPERTGFARNSWIPAM